MSSVLSSRRHRGAHVYRQPADWEEDIGHGLHLRFPCGLVCGRSARQCSSVPGTYIASKRRTAELARPRLRVLEVREHAQHRHPRLFVIFVPRKVHADMCMLAVPARRNCCQFVAEQLGRGRDAPPVYMRIDVHLVDVFPVLQRTLAGEVAALKRAHEGLHAGETRASEVHG